MIRVNRARSFQHFRDPQGLSHDPDGILHLQQSLEKQFIQRKRGRGCRILEFERNGELWFLIRHGAPYRREGSLSQGQSSSVFFRPEKHDVVILNPDSSELRIYAQSKWEIEAYREGFGFCLYGLLNYFPPHTKYSLKPLAEDGKDALSCTDIEGIEWVKLVEIQYQRESAFNEIDSHKSDDLFVTFENRGMTIPRDVWIRQAKFRVKFDQIKKPRTVTLLPPDKTKYTRDDDSIILEEWFEKRGFIDVGWVRRAQA